MGNQKALYCDFDDSVRIMPEEIAIREPGVTEINYRNLATLSD